jgi:hypothetical protein
MEFKNSFGGGQKTARYNSNNNNGTQPNTARLVQNVPVSATKIMTLSAFDH